MKKLLLLLLLGSRTLTGMSQVVSIPFTSSNLPIVVLDTDGQEILDDPKVTARMSIIDHGPGKRNLLTDTPNQYKGFIGIELRGSSSQTMPKKSYGFETQTAKGGELDTTLLGMPAEHDWVLTANYADKTLLRNTLTYELARQQGQYASRSRYCEVVLNGTYIGVYVLGEKIKRGSGRVNIPKMKATDVSGDAVTGGYLLKLDKLTGTPSGGFYSKHQDPKHPDESGIYIQIEYPKAKDIADAQLRYISAYVDSFEVALNGPDFTNARTGYRRYLDVPSFVDYFLLTELSRNIDAFYASTFFYKDRYSKKGKLTMGPVWDYDIAWHNANFNNGDQVEGWQHTYSNGQWSTGPFWRRRLLEDTAFTAQLNRRWAVLRNSTLSEKALYHSIDSTANLLAESQVRNFQAWPIMGQYVWPNPAPVAASYEGEIANLKQWIHDRLNWIDQNLPGGKTGSVLATQRVQPFAELAAFPGPFQDKLRVRYQQRQSGAIQLELISPVGRVVQRQQLPPQTAGPHELELNNLASIPAGVYFLRLSSASGSQTLRVQKASE